MAVTDEDGGDGARLYRIIATVTEPPPVEWATIIGDVVHNTPSAMDNAVWSAADPAERGKHTGHDMVRLGGRHLRIALRHRDWNNLSESERWDRIHGYHR